MNSKRYSCSISRPLIVENIKRFWIGSMFALIGYIIVCIVPMMLGKEMNENFVEELLFGCIPPLVGIIVVVPVFAAILIYRYMQQQSSTAIVHSLPFSRKQLFNSSYLSGIILCLVPVIIIGIIMIIISVISGPVLKVNFDPNSGFTKTNILTVMNILQWVVKYCIINIAVYTISSLCAVLTGTTLIQLMMSIGGVVAIPAILYACSGIGKKLLFGYVTPDWIDEISMYTSPISAAVDPQWRYVLCQLAVSLILYIIGLNLYKKRNLEKATDTLVFNMTKPIVKYFLTFMGMCAGGLFLDSFNNNGGLVFFLSGAFAGALIVYIGVDMMIQKSFKIKGFVKGFGIYAVVAVAIFGLMAVDVIGFESKIPDIDEIKGISLSGFSDEYIYYGDDVDQIKLVEEPAVISEMQAYHKDIINERDNLFSNSLKNINGIKLDDDEYTVDVNITYVLKNGQKIRRQYTLPVSWSEKNTHAQTIAGSEAYKKVLYPVLSWDINETDLKSVALITSYEGDVFGKQGQVFYDERMTQILEALKSDILALKFNEMNLFGNYIQPLFTIEAKVDNSSEIDPEINKQYYDYYGCYYGDTEIYNSFEINSGYANTINLLNVWGIYWSLVVTPEDVDHVTIQKVKNTDYSTDFDGEEYNRKIGEAVTITDPSIIADIFYSADMDASSYTNEDGCYYEIYLYPKVIKSQDAEFAYRYYDGGKLPDFLNPYFQ